MLSGSSASGFASKASARIAHPRWMSVRGSSAARQNCKPFFPVAARAIPTVWNAWNTPLIAKKRIEPWRRAVRAGKPAQGGALETIALL